MSFFKRKQRGVSSQVSGDGGIVRPKREKQQDEQSEGAQGGSEESLSLEDLTEDIKGIKQALQDSLGGTCGC